MSRGVPVYMGWEDSTDEWELDQVPLLDLSELPSKVYGLFDGSPTPVARVTGHLIYDEGGNIPSFYRLELERA